MNKSILETKFPHVVQGIIEHWHSENTELYLESLIFMDRDLQRQGFDLDVINEILFLYNIHATLYRTIRNENASPWDRRNYNEPLVSE